MLNVKVRFIINYNGIIYRLCEVEEKLQEFLVTHSMACHTLNVSEEKLCAQWNMDQELYIRTKYMYIQELTQLLATSISKVKTRVVDVEVNFSVEYNGMRFQLCQLEEEILELLTPCTSHHTLVTEEEIFSEELKELQKTDKEVEVTLNILDREHKSHKIKMKKKLK